MKRRRDWAPRLAAAIEMRRAVRGFAWGDSDCALFAADCIAEMTGVDLAAQFRGRYSTPAEALKVLNEAGHADLCALAASRLEEIHPAYARTGDVMAIASEATGWALGVVTGDRVTVITPAGLGTISREEGQRAFRVR